MKVTAQKLFRLALNETVLVIALSSKLHALDWGADLGTFNDDRCGAAVSSANQYLSGSFSSLIMVSSGFLAVALAAFGNHGASLCFLGAAAGILILHSFG